MAFEFDDQVGTGQTYTTPQSWMTARYTNTSWSDHRRQRILAELFGSFAHNQGVCKMTNAGDTNNVSYLYNEADDGAEHDGRFNANSAAGNARWRVTGSGSALNGVMENRDGYSRLRISWLELDMDDEGGALTFRPSAGDLEAHHNLVAGTSTSVNKVLIIGLSSGTNSLYRNAGVETIGSDDFYNSCSYIDSLHNTFGGGDHIFEEGDTSRLIERNFAFDCGLNCYNTGANQGENAATDATGDTGFDNLTSSDQIEDSNLTLAAFDPTIKSTGTIYQASTTTYSTTTYPEIDVPITDREATITGTWSIGADDVGGVAPTGANLFVNVTWWLR